MPGNLNKIWEAISGDLGTAWGLSRSSGWQAARRSYRAVNLGGAGKSGQGWAKGVMSTGSQGKRFAISMAARGLSGAVTGALVGGAWGAVSDNETIMGGAMKGAFVGAAGRIGARGMNLRSTRGMARLTQAGNMRENVSWAMNAMNSGRVRGMRNWVIGSAALGAAQGMLSGEDNPIGGAIGGTIGGGVRGAALYGAYRGIKHFRGK